MKTQQAKAKYSKRQIIMATLLTEFAIGVGAGLLHPTLGIATDVAFIITHVLTYKDENHQDE